MKELSRTKELSRQLSHLDNARRFCVSRFPGRAFAAKMAAKRAEKGALASGNGDDAEALAALMYRGDEF